MEDLKRLVSTSDHAPTRREAEGLRRELIAMGFSDMPALCWQSNQCSSAQAFLVYEPPMKKAWWTPVSSIAMDTTAGHQALDDELRAHGFYWAPGDAL